MKKFKNNNNKNLFVVVAFNSLTFLSTLSFAEDGFNSCNALLQAGIYNTSQTDNANDSELLRKSSFCAYDYSKVQESSAQATSIQASYGLFDGGVKHQATKSEIVEKQTSVCQNVFGSEKYSSKASSFARNVYQGSLDAWNRCQSLQQKGVNFDLQTSQNLQGVTLELSTSSIGSTVNFNGLDQIGLGRSICTTTRNASNGSSTGKVLTVDKTTSLKFNSSSKLAITCERQMSGDGKGGLYADAQTLVFNTSAGSYQVPMVAIALAPRIPVEEAVAKLESNINSQITNLESKLEKVTTDVNTQQTQFENFKNGFKDGLVFGGAFQVDDLAKPPYGNNINNPWTNALSCPPGFSKYASGRIWAPESKNGAWQYYCVK
jgi:hypothetical protein